MNQSLITLLLKQKALDLGFDACGVAQAKQLTEDAAYLQYWLSQNYHAGMEYLERHVEKREDITLLVEGAKSVVVMLMSYKPAERQAKDLPRIACYAYGKDYHEIIREKLDNLLSFLRQYYPQVKGRAFVDTAPILERAWAVRAGLGWIGKNTMLINQTLGSFTFIAELVVDVELTYDKEETRKYCGSCTRCLEACPTKGLKASYTIDANRCIAYHTIENKEESEVDTAGYLFGCDICQHVCPWNKKAPSHQHPELASLQEVMQYTLDNCLNMEEESFAGIFAKSPLKRAGLEKLKTTARKMKS